MKKTFSKKIKGFTLVEALVAISILMVAIAGPMSLAQRGTQSATQSTDQMIAAYMAQDAMEAVKNIRDEVALSNATTNTFWLWPFADSGDGYSCFCVGNESACSLDTVNIQTRKKSCNIDTTQLNLSNAINKTQIAHTLRITNDPQGNFVNYNLSQGIPSGFNRYLNISTTTTPGEALVRIRVEWGINPSQNYINLEDYIYNYSNNPYIVN